jgi:hypothetical protein
MNRNACTDARETKRQPITAACSLNPRAAIPLFLHVMAANTLLKISIKFQPRIIRCRFSKA